MKDIQLEEKPCTMPFKKHPLSLSVSRVGQMHQGKATSWKGQGKTHRDAGGAWVDLTGGIHHSLKMLTPYQTHIPEHE